MAGIMGGVMQHIDVGKPDDENEQGAQGKGCQGRNFASIRLLHPAVGGLGNVRNIHQKPHYVKMTMQGNKPPTACFLTFVLY